MSFLWSQGLMSEGFKNHLRETVSQKRYIPPMGKGKSRIPLYDEDNAKKLTGEVKVFTQEEIQAYMVSQGQKKN